jgi:hypothetical protein
MTSLKVNGRYRFGSPHMKCIGGGAGSLPQLRRIPCALRLSCALQGVQCCPIPITAKKCAGLHNEPCPGELNRRAQSLRVRASGPLVFDPIPADEQTRGGYLAFRAGRSAFVSGPVSYNPTFRQSIRVYLRIPTTNKDELGPVLN